MKETLIVVGHKEGKVYLQNMGNADVNPSHVAWTPEQAREVASLLLASADAAEADIPD